jgi:hypothetical protein
MLFTSSGFSINVSIEEESKALRRWSCPWVVLGPGSSLALEVAGSMDSGSNVSKLERS